MNNMITCNFEIPVKEGFEFYPTLSGFGHRGNKQNIHGAIMDLNVAGNAIFTTLLNASDDGKITKTGKTAIACQREVSINSIKNIAAQNAGKVLVGGIEPEGECEVFSTPVHPMINIAHEDLIHRIDGEVVGIFIPTSDEMIAKYGQFVQVLDAQHRCLADSTKISQIVNEWGDLSNMQFADIFIMEDVDALTTHYQAANDQGRKTTTGNRMRNYMLRGLTSDSETEMAAFVKRLKTDTFINEAGKRADRSVFADMLNIDGESGHGTIKFDRVVHHCVHSANNIKIALKDEHVKDAKTNFIEVFNCKNMNNLCCDDARYVRLHADDEEQIATRRCDMFHLYEIALMREMKAAGADDNCLKKMLQNKNIFAIAMAVPTATVLMNKKMAWTTENIGGVLNILMKDVLNGSIADADRLHGIGSGELFTQIEKCSQELIDACEEKSAFAIWNRSNSLNDAVVVRA